MSINKIKSFTFPVESLIKDIVHVPVYGTLRHVQYIGTYNELVPYGLIVFYIEVDESEQTDPDEDVMEFHVIHTDVDFERRGLFYWRSVSAENLGVLHIYENNMGVRLKGKTNE